MSLSRDLLTRAAAWEEGTSASASRPYRYPHRSPPPDPRSSKNQTHACLLTRLWRPPLHNLHTDWVQDITDANIMLSNSIQYQITKVTVIRCMYYLRGCPSQWTPGRALSSWRERSQQPIGLVFAGPCMVLHRNNAAHLHLGVWNPEHYGTS